MSQRTERIDELLRQEIGAILAREVADPRIGFVTVTDVETANDLRHAKVWVSVIGQQAERDEALIALNRAMSFVRRELGTRLRLRRIPEFHVEFDDSAERGTRVLRLLQDLEKGQVPGDPPTPGESLPTPLPRLARDGDAAEEPPEARTPKSTKRPASASWQRNRGGQRAGPRQGQPGRGTGKRKPR
jgi:ribosome-binding factor A